MKKYFITSSVSEKIISDKIKKHQPEYVLYRNKPNTNYATEAQKFVNVCSKFTNINIFIHRDVELAYRLNVTGVHLTSIEFDKIKKAKDLKLNVIISTHTKNEVLMAQEEGADYVTYSPIFSTPHKGRPKGIKELQELLKACKIKVFALGGIVSENEVEAVAKTNVYGFASIRYFE